MHNMQYMQYKERAKIVMNDKKTMIWIVAIVVVLCVCTGVAVYFLTGREADSRTDDERQALSGDVNDEEVSKAQQEEFPAQKEDDKDVSVETDVAYATHMPVDGYYYNSTDGALPHTCEIYIQRVSEDAFRFSIKEIFDENGEVSDKVLFEENVAVFESESSENAVCITENNTLIFECNEEGYVTLNGFDDATALGKVFENMAFTNN